MRKIHVLLLALFAVSAFGAVLVASASAETTLLAEWLTNSMEINGNGLFAEVTGALLLEDSKTLAGAAAVVCKGVLFGTIGENGLGLTTSVLNVNEEQVGVLGGLALLGTGTVVGEGSECKTERTCAAGTTASPIEVWPVGLPWESRLFLMANGEISVLFGGAVETGYELLCLVLGLNVEDTCTLKAPEGFELPVVNNVKTGDAETPTKSAMTPRALCTQSKEETGVSETEGALVFSEIIGELLTVSSVS